MRLEWGKRMAALPLRGQGPDLAGTGRSPVPRLKTSPGLLVRALVSLGAVAAIGGAVAAYTSGRTPLVADMTAQVLALVVIGALARRYGIPLPGNGFASYILGVVAYAVLDHGWPFALLVAPLAMLVA